MLRAELEAAKCSHLKEGAAIRELSKINKKEQEDLARANRENALVEQFTAKKKMMETYVCNITLKKLLYVYYNLMYLYIQAHSLMDNKLSLYYVCTYVCM